MKLWHLAANNLLRSTTKLSDGIYQLHFWRDHHKHDVTDSLRLTLWIFPIQESRISLEI